MKNLTIKNRARCGGIFRTLITSLPDQKTPPNHSANQRQSPSLSAIFALSRGNSLTSPFPAFNAFPGCPSSASANVPPPFNPINDFNSFNCGCVSHSASIAVLSVRIAHFRQDFLVRGQSLYSSVPSRPLRPLREAFRVFGVFRGCPPLSLGYARLFCRSTLNSRPSTSVAAWPRGASAVPLTSSTVSPANIRENSCNSCLPSGF